MKFDIPESLHFANLPTPLEKIKAPGNYNLWIKRDDMTGLELSGNKIRKLNFLFKEALDRGADGIITCGGLQSNHCRTAAYLAQKLGLDCVLFLRGKATDDPNGNYLLNLLTNAGIHYVTKEEYDNIDNIMDDEARRQRNLAQNYYVIPEGGSNATGALGYCQCFYEIKDQLGEEGLPIEAVAVASGSGGTHAGLLAGKILSGSNINIFSVNVCDTAVYFKTKIQSILDQFFIKYAPSFQVPVEKIDVYDGYVGAGYGEIGEKEVQLIIEMVRQEGIVLDPVYTAKAFLGLKELMQNEKLDYRNVLFIHTGGIFGIFPYARYFV
jgi:D-cysteine desulfhydrase